MYFVFMYILTFIHIILEDQGAAVVQALDAEQALELALKEKPDLITLDVSMPEKSGIKLYREVKANDRWKQIPIIIVTGVSEDFKKFISTRHHIPPPEGYLSKPIDAEEILALIKKLTA